MALAVYLKDNIFIIIQIKIFSNIYWNFLDALFKLISNYLGFPGNSAGKESACNSGDPSSIPGSGRSLGEGKGYPLQYSGLENFMDRGALRATVHEVTKSLIRLSDFQFSKFPESFSNLTQLFTRLSFSCKGYSCDKLRLRAPNKGLFIHMHL